MKDQLDSEKYIHGAESLMGEISPFERLPGESSQAWAAFCLYRDLGPNRSIDTAWELQKGSNRAATTPPVSGARASGRWFGWSVQWRWVDRALCYDAYQAATEAAKREQALTAKAQQWAERRAAQSEDEWQTAQELRAKARLMLAWPLEHTTHTERTQQTGDSEHVVHVTEIHPARWSYRDALAFSLAASKLSRQACDIDTDIAAHVGETQNVPQRSDATPLIAQLQAWLLAATPEQRGILIEEYEAFRQHSKALQHMLASPPGWNHANPPGTLLNEQ